MKPSDLDLLNSVSEPTLHPDGSRAVVSVQRPDFPADAYVGQLWNVYLDGRDPHRITRGFSDTAPQFSPDGRTLAFLRTDQGGRPQLYAVPADGGEPVRLTDRRLGVSWFRFSPDSTRIVFSSREPEQGRYGTVDGVGPGAEDPRLISTFQYRMNGAGFSRDKYVQAFVLTLPDLTGEPFIQPVGRVAAGSGAAPGGLPEALRLTDLPADTLHPVFTADGERVLFTASLHSGADEDLVEDVYAVNGDGSSDPVRLTNLGGGPRLSASFPVESADGAWLFFLAQDLSETGLDFVARNTALYAAPAQDPSRPVRLTDPETMDLAGGGIIPAGGDTVLVFNLSRGGCELLRASAGGTLTSLVAGPRVVTGAAAAATGAVVCAFTDALTAGDVAIPEPSAPEQVRVLTDFSAALRDGPGVLTLQEESHPSADGYPVHGWVVVPEGEGPHPVLLNIHGGPFSQYGWGLFDEAQVYAAAGYAVVMCNPRGSAGYGQAHGRSIKEAMGTLDLLDVLGFLDGVLAAHPELDSGRLGVMGGSYGGYLTAWTISQDHRFTAAIVERGFLDPLSFVGSSDIGWFFSAAYTGSRPERVLEQSPFAQVDKVRTPALVIHSEEDLRCPVEQAQRYYTALKLRGVPTEMLLFPGENHELSRTGTPWHRRQRFEHILQWWARWLPSAANPGAELQADDGERATAGV